MATLAEPEATNTGQAWSFEPYTLEFRGRNDVPERFLKRALWEDHQGTLGNRRGTLGYYAHSEHINDAAVAVEFNHEHLCWVEVRYSRSNDHWTAFRIMAPDLGLQIQFSDLTSEELERVLEEDRASEASQVGAH